MSIILRLSYIFALVSFSLAFVIYLLVPNPPLPPPMPDSLVSPEPADRAFLLRPAYFNQKNREQTTQHYENYLANNPFPGMSLLTYRLNYPPEDSSFLVRPHMYSSYLEEVVHPFRESLYINGFSPTEPKDDIRIYGVRYNQKVTVKYVPSSVYSRLLIGVLSMLILFVITRELFSSTKSLFKF